MRAELTEKQLTTLGCIVAYRKEHGQSPRIKDIASILGLSISAAARSRNYLFKHRVIDILNEARGIRVTRKGLAKWNEYCKQLKQSGTH